MLSRSKCEAEEKPLSVFDIINSLSSGRPELMYDSQMNVNTEILQKYTPFLINRAFSMHLSSLTEAQCMNRCSNLPKLMQYDFYRHALRKEKRYGKKWPKERDLDKLNAISSVYECSIDKAREILTVLSDEQLNYLMHGTKGGKTK